MARITVDSFGENDLRLEIEYNYYPAEEDTNSPEEWEILSVSLGYNEFSCEVNLLNDDFGEEKIIAAIKKQLERDAEEARIDQLPTERFFNYG